MTQFKVKYTVFDNFSSHKIVEFPYDINQVDNVIKIIIYNMIKDEEFHHILTYSSLSIDKINKIE